MKKILAAVLTVLLIFSLGTVAFAAGGTKTAVFLGEVAKTQKLSAHVTGHTYADKSNSLDFDIYDDFSTGKICCDLNGKGIQAIYDGGEVKCIFKYLFCYLTASPQTVPFMGTAVAAVEAFQSILKAFLNDPSLSSFTCTTSTVERGGKTCTKETFTGKIVKVSGSFYYDGNGKLCEIQLTDTLGASISFTVENVSADFGGDVFTVPTYYIDLSVLWKILSMLLSVFIAL